MKNFIFLNFLSLCIISFAQTNLSFSNEDIIYRLKTDVSVLAHDSLKGRKSCSEYEYKAGNYISNLYKSLNLSYLPKCSSYRQKIFKKHRNDSYNNTSNSYNILAFVNNNRPYTVVIGAHYDHLGVDANDSNMIFNGADDNASGTAAVLEIARYVACGNLNSYNYILACWGSEEEGLLGSDFFCKSKIYPFNKIAFYVNFDMIGRLGWNKNQIDILGLGSSSSWKSVVPNTFSSSYKIKKIAAAIDVSDHACFYKNRKPFIYFTSGLHPEYHTVNDKLPTINFAGINTIISLTKDIIGKLNGQKIEFREFSGFEIFNATRYFY